MISFQIGQKVAIQLPVESKKTPAKPEPEFTENTVPKWLRTINGDGTNCEQCVGHNNKPLCHRLPCLPEKRTDNRYVYFVFANSTD